MELIVDSIVYRYQIYGGITRIFDNILPWLCKLDPGLRVKMINTRGMAKGSTEHKRISKFYLKNIDRSFQPRKLWRRKYLTIYNQLLQYFIGETEGKTWLSTYYTLPPYKWNGRLVVFAYDFIYELFPSQLINSESIIRQKRDTLQRADAVICISNATARDLLDIYPIDKSKIHVAQLGYNKIFRRREKVEIKNRIGTPFLLYVGVRQSYKNFFLLLNAFSHSEASSKIKLIVVGPPWSDEEESFITNNDLKDKLILLNNISDDNLCDLYNQASAFIYPSLYEGFGIPLLEAMACGCPVVASEIASSKEVAHNVPYYFQPTDESGLIRAINLALACGKENEKIQEGFETVAQYSWEKTAIKVLEVIK